MLRIGLAFVAGLLVAGSAAAQEKPVEADVLLKGGTIYDGTGSPGRVGDVAIRGQKIVAVGEFPVGQVDLVIDCRGLVIAPGFIDLHTHSDSQVVDPDLRGCVNYVIQGCTTSVTGNCGGGPVNVGEYYRKINAAGAGTNVAHLLPQGSLRGQVVGPDQRKATPDEIEKMRQLADKAMRDGAWGMSTGLIYTPSSFADTEEIIEIAKVVAQHHGIYASHIRGEGRDLLDAVAEALRIGREAALPVHVSHFKASGERYWGTIRAAADMIEKARQSGRTATADQYPYTASSTSLEAILLPTWSRSGGQKALLKRLDDPEQSPRIRNAVAEMLNGRNGGAAIFLARYRPRQDWVGRNLQEIADAEKKEPIEVAFEIIRKGGAAVVNFSMSEDDVRFAMQLPWVATASDGRSYIPGADKPHPRSYGTFARKIGRYAIQEKVIPLEHAIRSASGLPADIIGFKDRGYLKSDMAADIAVFDPKEYIDIATFPEPHQYARGMRFVFVNGKPAVFNGTPTGALAGRALNGPGAAAESK